MGIFSAGYTMLTWLWTAIKSVFNIFSFLPLILQQILIIILIIKFEPLIEKILTIIVNVFVWLFNKLGR